MVEHDLEPNEGNYFKPSVLMIHSGQFWRCAHGFSKMGTYECRKCAKADPRAYAKWYGIRFTHEGTAKHIDKNRELRNPTWFKRKKK